VLDLFTHFVKRDETNKYCVTVSLGNSVSIGQVGVIDLETGNNVSVAVTSIATSYLSGINNPLADLRALTVADYTFLVNKKKEVAKDANAYSRVPDKEALVVVKLGDYEKGYSVYIDDTIVPLSSNIASNPHSYTHHTHQEATYISGPSSGTGAGKYADTEYIAKDLAECISQAYATSRVGVTSVNFTNGGSGWLQGNLQVIVRRFISFFHGYAMIPVSASAYPRKVEFTIKQTVGGVVNKSAKGVCDVQNGVIQSFTFTHNGSNYDSNVSGTQALQFELVQKAYVDGAWRLASGNTPTSPTFGTPSATIAIVPPLIVERQGSVIRLRKTINVSNGGSNYLLKRGTYSYS